MITESPQLDSPDGQLPGGSTPGADSPDSLLNRSNGAGGPIQSAITYEKIPTHIYADAKLPT